MDATWIVTANAGRARFFSQADATEPLEEINDMVNDAARLRTSESETDRMGPTSAGKSIHNTGGATPNKQYEPHQTPVERATEMFAKEVAQYLEKAHLENRYGQLCLIASPQFLGILRQQLDANLESAVNRQLNKDYTHLSAQQLLEKIQEKPGNEGGNESGNG